MESPIMFQNFWKNIGWKPSGPGALSGLNDLMAASISARVGGVARMEHVLIDKELNRVRFESRTGVDSFSEVYSLTK
jgi:hypothetical protein